MITAVVSLSHAVTPLPLAGDAPATRFASARAMVHLEKIAAVPHPIGSAANAQVRDYLVGQLSALGLQPRIQSSFSVPRRTGATDVGMVQNIVARLPGREHGKALMLAAHYDSVPTGQGAADDGASVAAILETVRALRAGPPLAHDLIVLLTDGEEAGLLGSEAFVADDPVFKDVGLVMNFEYRGNSGPFQMFETSPGNARLVEGFARAPLAIGSSLLYEVYKVLPNDTDMTPFKRGGIPGMNFAAIEGATAYHSRLDRPDMLSQASLQHQGDTMLALARHFGTEALAQGEAQDRIYFDVAGIGLVHYPAGWALPLTAVTALAFVLALVQAVRSGAVRPGRIFAVVPFFLIMAVLLAVASNFMWMGVNLLHPGYRLMPDTYNSHWYLLFFVALASGLFMLLLGAVKNWFSHLEIGYAALACAVFGLLAVALQVPGASFVLTWPLLGVSLSLLLAQSAAVRAAPASRRALILFAGAIPALLLFTPLLRTLYIALSPRLIMVVVLLLMVLLGMLTPLLGMLRQRFLLPAMPLAAALVFLAAGAATAGFDDQHPRANNLSYVQAPQPLWVSTDRVLDDWTGRYFPASASRRMLPEIEGKGTRLHWTGPAPALGLAAPTIDVLSDEVQGQQRALKLRIASPRQAATLRVYLDGADVLAASVQGKPFTSAPTKDWQLAAHGISTTPLDIALTVPAGRPLSLRAVDISYGLPQTDLPPRPNAMMAQPLVQSDTTQAVTRIEVK